MCGTRRQRGERVQLSRRRGYRLPQNAVSIAHPTRWRNPYRPRGRTPGTNAAALPQFCDYLAAHPELVDDARRHLAGHDLACWCSPDLARHGDAWLIAIDEDGHAYVQELNRFHDTLLNTYCDPQ